MLRLLGLLGRRILLGLLGRCSVLRLLRLLGLLIALLGHVILRLLVALLRCGAIGNRLGLLGLLPETKGDCRPAEMLRGIRGDVSRRIQLTVNRK